MGDETIGTTDAASGSVSLRQRWRQAWEPALALWSRYARLREPVWCETDRQARAEGLTGSFAMIRLVDQAVVVSLPAVVANGVDGFALEILAHEIGHHMLCPADLADQGRLLARVRRGLPTREQFAPLVANLYADLLINDRLQRSSGLRLADVYRSLPVAEGPPDRLWLLVMRICEILWRLDRGWLTREPPTSSSPPPAAGALSGGAEGPPESRSGEPEPAEARPADSQPASAVAATSKMNRGAASPKGTSRRRRRQPRTGQPADEVAASPAAIEGDARLGARLIRVFARDWLAGAGRFAALCFRYLAADESGAPSRSIAALLDTEKAGLGGAPDGLVGVDPDEAAGAVHPADDPEVAGGETIERSESQSAGRRELVAARADGAMGSAGQCRQPFEYGELLRAMGIEMTADQVAARYYRELAVPHLIAFPTPRQPRALDRQLEGLDPWDVGSPLTEVDWIESVARSPVIVPGVTTVSRHHGQVSGDEPQRLPVDLDLYVDSSGSMPDPRHSLSYLTLAGAIIALSALRVGARVQVTLWSGPRQFVTTGGFTTDETAILDVLTGFFGGCTAFPIHVLRDTYSDRGRDARMVHILSISDEGQDTMFATDEQGNDGWQIARMALERARGGGTFVLNVQPWQLEQPVFVRAAAEGWRIHSVTAWSDLVAFARAFARNTYGEGCR